MPEFNFEANFLDTVGLESESFFLDKEKVSEKIFRALQPIFGNRRVVNITRDASAEIYIKYLRLTNTKSILISTHTDVAGSIEGLQRMDERVVGYEYFTNPLSIYDMERFIYPTIFTLVGMGDSVSERAATHIHVGFAHNLRLMKRLLRICLAIDPILFRLGGMGGVFRGWKNHAAYARPLMNSVAVRVVKDSAGNRRPMRVEDLQIDSNGNIRRTTQTRNTESDEEISINNDFYSTIRYAKAINPIEALNSKTTEDFWASFGVTPTNLTKYHPTRYTAINFYAILAHGTIEFRHFNSSLDPQLILSTIKFLRAMVEVSTLCSKEEILSFEILPCNQQISIGDASEIMDRIMQLCRKYDVENLPTDNEMDILYTTLSNSTFIPLPETPVLTHINDFLLTDTLAKRGKLEFVDEILQPNHVDIHNIKNKESSLFDTTPEAL